MSKAKPKTVHVQLLPNPRGVDEVVIGVATVTQHSRAVVKAEDVENAKAKLGSLGAYLDIEETAQ